MAKELQHVGILGMHWGIRRSGNKSSSTGRVSSKDHTEATVLKKKHLSEMSNDELKKLTNRLQLEKQYKDLTKVELTGGKKFMADILQNTGKQIVSQYLGEVIKRGGAPIIKLLTNRFTHS